MNSILLGLVLQTQLLEAYSHTKVLSEWNIYQTNTDYATIISAYMV